MSKNLVVSGKIREFAEGMSVSSDFYGALNAKLIVLIKEAVRRAKLNGRKTVQSRDL